MSKIDLVVFETEHRVVAINPQHVTRVVYSDTLDVVQIHMVDGKHHSVDRPDEQHVVDCVKDVCRRFGYSDATPAAEA